MSGRCRFAVIPLCVDRYDVFMQKKRKLGLWITLAVVVLIVIGGAVWAKGYYEDHYVGSDYYTVIPEGYDLTPEPLRDKNGNVMEFGKEFRLTGYDAQGGAKDVDFTVKGDESSDFPQPGTYLKVVASKYLVNGWSVIDESSVPDKALEQIKAH